MPNTASPASALLQRAQRWSPLVALAFSLALYAPSLGHGLTNWDDPLYVEHNPIASQGLAGLDDAFTRTVDGAWYPVNQLAYTLIQAVAGPSPLAHHLSAWLLFAVAAALAPLALRAFGVPVWLGTAATLLWIAHPFRPESVSWVGNLKDPLSILGVFACFALLGAGRRWLAWAAFAFALLSKSMVFPLALLVPWLYWRRGDPPGRAFARAWPFLAASAAIALVAALSHSQHAETWNTTRPGGGGLLTALPTIAWLPLWYLGRTLWPAAPRALYELDPVGWLDWRLAVAVAAGAAVVVTLVRLREHRPVLIAFVGAYLLPLATVTGAAPMRHHLADRYTLLPSLALATGLVLLVQRWLPRRLGAAAVVATLVALAIPNVLRQREWRDGLSLWSANVAVEPGIWEVHVNLAGEYGGVGRWDDAIRHLEQARRLAPENQRQRVLGDLFFAYAARAGLPLPWLEARLESLKRAAFSAPAQLEVASELIKAGHAPVARALLEPLAAAAPSRDVARARELIARSHLAQKNFPEAMVHARRALELAPESGEARVDLVIALAEQGRLDDALRESGVEVPNPRDQALVQGARGYVLFKLGRLGEAQELLERARQALGADAPF